jgi:predicted 3-demethylubiquinone-9 3-methyltransferase (glyoxalase superfamily)
MPKITPFLWFDDQAEEAMHFYVSIFKNSRVLGLTRYGASGPGPANSVMTASFVLDGQEFVALNGGPHFSFNEAVSFFVRCESQQEIDEFWARLGEGGQTSRCGWLKDKFGLWWQIVPSALEAMLQDSDPAKSNRVMQAMLQMDKLDIERLRQAHQQA